MASRSARSEGKLATRIGSAAVLIAIALGAVLAGERIFAAFLGAVGAVLCWEWVRLCAENGGGVREAMMATAAAVPAVVLVAGPATAVVLVGLVTGFVLALSAIRKEPAFWTLAAGLPYVSAALVAAMWLYFADATGPATILWLAAVIGATDIGAYFIGRTVGGPRLAPRVSPNKTWAGLLGGIAAAAVTGAFVGVFVPASPYLLAVLGGGLAIVAQLGDLFESALKRRFGVKDSSRLIPGHGGFLDRLDGYLTVVPVVALMAVARGGSPLLWQ